VFVTAFDHYALEAFDRAAVDYLLKPVSDRRLVRTITKLKRDKGPVLADVQLLLQQMGESNKPNYLVWLRAGLDDVTELLSVDEVVFFGQNRNTPAFSQPTKSI
jgi:DNA-binding LytR/AlgR family response regulator